ncbi:MAG: AMP-binding protein [Thermodesulfobacteriota bacterium]
MSNNNFNPVKPFYDNALLNPENLALWVDNTLYTYRELAIGACRLAKWLCNIQEQPVKRVALLTNRSIASYLGILGAGWVGACYVPLNPIFPEKRLLNIISQAKPDALIVGKECIELLTPKILELFSGKIILANDKSFEVHGQLIDGLYQLPSPTEFRPPSEIGADSEAYLVFTSGTTGQPNGVAINAGNLAFAIQTLLARYPFDESDRFSQFFEISFDFSVMDIFVPWQVGASTHVVPQGQRLGPGHFIQDQQLTVWTCVPNMINLMNQMKMLKPGIFPSLRFSCFSGETLTAAAARIWQDATPNGKVVNLYGQTEAPIGSLVQTFSPEAPLTTETGGLALGSPLKGTMVGIINPNNEFVKPGTKGELALAGPHIASGYLNSPERTKNKFRNILHPVYGFQDWYISGDLAFQEENSIFHFLGRTDTELKVGSYRVMLEEVEYYLLKHTNYHTVAITPWHNHLGVAEALIGFVVTDKEVNESKVKKSMGQDLPRAMLPRRIFAIPELPLNPNGKIDRNALAQIADKLVGL